MMPGRPPDEQLIELHRLSTTISYAACQPISDESEISSSFQLIESLISGFIPQKVPLHIALNFEATGTQFVIDPREPNQFLLLH